MAESKLIYTVERFDGGAKGLPKHEGTGLIENVFYANGTKYFILTEDDAFPVSRWTLFSKYVVQFMSGMEFQNVFNVFQRIEDVHENCYHGKARISDAVVITRSAKEEVFTLSQTKYATALYICTLVILKEGENINTWSAAEAEEKIKNWSEEGFNALDFFAIAAHFVAIYSSALSVLTELVTNVMLPKVPEQTPQEVR